MQNRRDTRTTKWTKEECLAIARAILKYQETTGRRITFSHIVRAGVGEWMRARGFAWPPNEKEHANG